MKFKKNKVFDSVNKVFAEKESGFVKKLIKNISGAYQGMIEEVKDAEKWKNIDLR